VRQALRVVGLAAEPGFARYDQVLNRARWNGRSVARRLLAQLLTALLPAGEVVIARHDRATLGSQDQGTRDLPRSSRSSHGHFVKASGLRWLSLMVMVPIPWAGRRWALPFLTTLDLRSTAVSHSYTMTAELALHQERQCVSADRRCPSRLCKAATVVAILCGSADRRRRSTQSAFPRPRPAPLF
jgi:hypothetical protein